MTIFWARTKLYVSISLVCLGFTAGLFSGRLFSIEGSDSGLVFSLFKSGDSPDSADSHPLSGSFALRNYRALSNRSVNERIMFLKSLHGERYSDMANCLNELYATGALNAITPDEVVSDLESKFGSDFSAQLDQAKRIKSPSFRRLTLLGLSRNMSKHDPYVTLDALPTLPNDLAREVEAYIGKELGRTADLNTASALIRSRLAPREVILSLLDEWGGAEY